MRLKAIPLIFNMKRWVNGRTVGIFPGGTMKVFKRAGAKIKTYLKGLKKPVIRIDLPNSPGGEKWVRVLADLPQNRGKSQIRW